MSAIFLTRPTLLDQRVVDSVDTRLLFDNPMDDPRRLHRSGNRDYRPRTAVLGRSGLFPRWHLANPFDRKPLVQLEFKRERYEADFRFALARLREYSEQVALLRARMLNGDFGRPVRLNRVELLCHSRPHGEAPDITTTYFQTNVVIPYIIVAPYFFLGKITLGQMTQDSRPFGRSNPRSLSLSHATSRWRLTSCRRTSDDISLGHRRGA